MINVNEISFRAATPDDSDIIFELFEQVQNIHLDAEPNIFKPPVKGEHFREFLDKLFSDKGRYLILAEINAQAIGYIQFSIGWKRESIYQHRHNRADIAQLVVAKSRRKCGVGTLLINQVKTLAKKSGAEILTIDYWSFNKASERCFTKAGFETKYLVMQQNL